MYVCLSGVLPFPGNSTDEIFQNVLFKDLMIFEDPKLEYLSTEAKDLLFKMLKRDSNQRITA
jgi:serine/threonine protein kinase